MGWEPSVGRDTTGKIFVGVAARPASSLVVTLRPYVYKELVALTGIEPVFKP
jgi:hypothetical protein